MSRAVYGEEIILTRNEVRFARARQSDMALYVLHSVEVTGGDQDPEVAGGEERILFSWNVDAGILEPVNYVYQLPETRLELAD